MIRITKLHTNTNGNSHTVKGFLYYNEFTYANSNGKAVCRAFRFSTRESLLKSLL
jgi:hypothetical protein